MWFQSKLETFLYTMIASLVAMIIVKLKLVKKLLDSLGLC
jgi:hypothetical protein